MSNSHLWWSLASFDHLFGDLFVAKFAPLAPLVVISSTLWPLSAMQIIRRYVAKMQTCGLVAFTCARFPSVCVQHLRNSTNVSLLSAPSAEILHTIRKHYSQCKTHICGGDLPRLITFFATFLLQDSLRWLLLSSSRPLCGQCPQCKSTA